MYTLVLKICRYTYARVSTMDVENDHHIIIISSFHYNDIIYERRKCPSPFMLLFIFNSITRLRSRTSLYNIYLLHRWACIILYHKMCLGIRYIRTLFPRVYFVFTTTSWYPQISRFQLSYRLSVYYAYVVILLPVFFTQNYPFILNAMYYTITLHFQTLPVWHIREGYVNQSLLYMLSLGTLKQFDKKQKIPRRYDVCEKNINIFTKKM